jgi:multiple sugar transport system substrate-binding protein
MAATVLNGITWGHSRGITPLLAVSQRYAELHPDVEIHWKKRTLQEFADFPIEKLTRDYDLLIIDHPWVGCADATRCVLPLDQYLTKEYLDDQLQHSVGYSHLSYNYNGSQWALAIDAAAPAASYRKDLIERNNVHLPLSWNDVLNLARKGKVAAPAIPIDLLMNFYSFCITNGNEPFRNEEEVVDIETGVAAIEMMRELYSLLDKRVFKCNPIAIAEWMASTDDFWYCPFAYCYTNYSRKGYAKALLHYADVAAVNGHRLRTTIGGTGISVSAFSKHREIALDFAALVVSGGCQRGMYVQNGGQPGHRSAWMDKEANALTHDFFANLLPVMDRGYIRPRYNGYLHFQDHAGDPLQQCVLNELEPLKTLEWMNKIYRESLKHNQSIVTV